MSVRIWDGLTCGISGKKIREGDNFFGVPAFPCDPQDPLVSCREACVLRDEFEKWELREALVRKAKEFLEQWFYASRAFLVIFHDDTYLIAESKIGKAARIIFLQHIFIIDVLQEEWKEFYDQMMGPVSEISTDLCTVKEKVQKVEISKISEYGQDCIEVSLEEWEHFQDALRIANEAMLD